MVVVVVVTTVAVMAVVAVVAVVLLGRGWGSREGERGVNVRHLAAPRG